MLMQKLKKILLFVVYLTLIVYAGSVLASNIGNLGEVQVSSFSVAKLIAAVCYLAGFAFIISAILKFKQYKDTTQILIGIALLIIGAALLFLPSLLFVTGAKFAT